MNQGCFYMNRLMQNLVLVCMLSAFNTHAELLVFLCKDARERQLDDFWSEVAKTGILRLV